MVCVMLWKENIQINGKVIAKVRELSRNVVNNNNNNIIIIKIKKINRIINSNSNTSNLSGTIRIFGDLTCFLISI